MLAACAGNEHRGGGTPNVWLNDVGRRFSTSRRGLASETSPPCLVVESGGDGWGCWVSHLVVPVAFFAEACGSLALERLPKRDVVREAGDLQPVLVVADLPPLTAGVLNGADRGDRADMLFEPGL
jgi:hypothetical protein